MSLRTKFENDPERFMSNHGIQIKAAGLALKNLANYGAFSDVKMHQDKVSLTAPSGYAKLTENNPKIDHDYIKCSVPFVDFELTSDQTEIPVYVIPYKGTAAMGAKLPTGHGRAYCITTRIDGCTFTVSGDRRTPYAAHSNAYVLKGSEQEKRNKMKAHISQMERRFMKAELLAGGDVRQVSENIVHFNYWHQPQLGQPDAFVNYAELAQQRVQLAIDSGAHHYREEASIGHRKYHVALTDEKRAELLGPEFMPFNAVIGVREGGLWTFYANTATNVEFKVRVENKLKGWTVNDNSTIFKCMAVLTWGEIWPEPDLRYRPFLTDVGALEH